MRLALVWRFSAVSQSRIFIHSIGFFFTAKEPWQRCSGSHMQRPRRKCL